MSAAYGKGAKAKATKLHSLIVRARGRCEQCGEADYTKLQAAHIISRRYSATRCDPANSWCLCYSCHRRVDEHADEFMGLVEATIGLNAYYALKAKARPTKKMDWDAELERLRVIAREMGVAA